MGDAINWEWIIECASESAGKENIVIVSRDGDFGTFYGKEAILNDWLRLEFKERVSRKRKIELRNTLSAALKLFDVNVSESDAKEERIVATATPETVSEGATERRLLKTILELTFDGKKEDPPSDDE